MEGKVNYTVVGAFVISLIAAIVFGIIWLSSGLSFERYTTYQVYMEESVTGLHIDSPVEFNGVQVGTVSEIEIDRENPQLVILLLSIKSETPITFGTIATLQTQGLTGVTHLALSDKSTDLRPLVAHPGQQYPIIPSAPSLFLKLNTALTKLSQDVEKITTAIDSLLDEQNQRSLKEILSNLRKASREFGPLLNSSRNMVKTLENQTLPATSRLFQNLDAASGNLTDISNQIRENPSVLIRGVSQPSLGPGER